MNGDLMNQESIFFNYEGDNWLKRNINKLNLPKQDYIIDILNLHNIVPENVLEIGASNGWRLNEITKIYGSKCTAIEPSKAAVEDGKKRYPNIIFHRAVASDLPFVSSRIFDLVIVNFVFHWIDREKLFKSVSEIDRVLDNKGYLIIGDFMPDFPNKVNYHHIKNEQVWTYKQDYTRPFTSSQIYTLVSSKIGSHDTKDLSSFVSSNNRISISLLKKNYDNYPVVELD